MSTADTCKFRGLISTSGAILLRRGLSIRSYVLAVVAGILIPVLIFAGAVSLHSAHSERVQLEKAASNQGREVLAVIEREATAIQDVLVTLAGSPLLQNEDFGSFYSQARKAAERIGWPIVLRDHQSHRQILHTAFPFGAAIPEPNSPQRAVAEAEVLRTDTPAISDVFFGSYRNQHIIVVAVPVVLDSSERYSLSAGVPLTRFSALLNSLDTQPDQVIGVLDNAGAIVTRSKRNAEFSGTPIGHAIPPGIQSTVRSRNREGIAFHWFNRRSTLTGWTVFVGIPDRILEAPATRALANVAVAGSLLLAIALALSYYWAGRLSKSVGALGIDRQPTRQEFEVLFNSSPNGVTVIGPDGIMALVNKRLSQKFGYAPGELIGQPIEILFPECFRDKQAFQEQKAFSKGTEWELMALCKDGSEFPVEIGFTAIATGMGNLVMATVVDLSVRKAAEQRLSVAISERDDLRRRYMYAQEQERLRLARELHDQTGQTLTASLLALKNIKSTVGENERSKLLLLRHQLEEMGRSLHRVAWELRPVSIDELGLEAALINHTAEWSAQYGIEADYYCTYNDLEGLTDELRTTIYRVVQEGLTNVAKHAFNATTVSIIVEKIGNALRLVIEDNGCGFNFDEMSFPASARLKGLGIAGMRQRLSLIGGKLQVESSLGDGTTIFAWLPLELKRSAA